MQWFDDIPVPPETFFRAATVANPRGTIIFIHGFTSTYYLHHAFVAQFDLSSYNYYAANLPNHQFRDMQDGIPHHFRMQNYVDFMKQIILEHDFHNIILIGHSMGGGVAAILAHEIPERIQKVILVSPINHAVYQCRVGLRYLLGTLTRNGEEVYRIEFADFPHLPYPDYEIERYIFLQHKFLFIGGKLLNLGWLGRLRRAYATLTVPTLVILGGADQVIPAAASAAFFRRLKNPRFTLKIVGGAGHVPFVDHLSVYLDLVQVFLNG